MKRVSWRTTDLVVALVSNAMIIAMGVLVALIALNVLRGDTTATLVCAGALLVALGLWFWVHRWALVQVMVDGSGITRSRRGRPAWHLDFDQVQGAALAKSPINGQQPYLALAAAGSPSPIQRLGLVGTGRSGMGMALPLPAGLMDSVTTALANQGIQVESRLTPADFPAPEPRPARAPKRRTRRQDRQQDEPVDPGWPEL